MTNFSAMQRAYDRKEPDTREADAYDDWLETTSFVNMLPESSINDVLELVLTNQPENAMTALYTAVKAAWEKHERACIWRLNEDGFWDTGCGNAFELTEGGPRLNKFNYCSYCGGTLIEKDA